MYVYISSRGKSDPPPKVWAWAVAIWCSLVEAQAGVRVGEYASCQSCAEASSKGC